MRRFLLLLLVLAGTRARAALPLDDLVSRTDIWTLTPASYQELAETQPFEWTSAARDSSRLARPGLVTLFGLPLVEAVARFKGDKLNEWTMLIYGRGDAGSLTKEEFTQLVQASIAALNAQTKVKFEARGKDPKSAVRADGVIWQTPHARYTLEYSFTRENRTRGEPFRAEFVRLQIAPPERTVGLLSTAGGSSPRNRFTGATHVKRVPATGDVFIQDVPMVDQGQKGYCAVACTERVMRYYGVAVDANELAQVANSDAERGTSAEAMFDALKKLGARLKVRTRVVEEPYDVRSVLALISDYNRAAKRAGEPPLPDPGRMLNLPMILGAMKPEIFREVRNRNKSDTSRFQRNIMTQIDSGTPVLWGVMLGMVPEPEIPQASGGHMRLIIGYNSPRNEIIYTDSWGAGHELKRMALPDAWAITQGLTVIEPM